MKVNFLNTNIIFTQKDMTLWTENVSVFPTPQPLLVVIYHGEKPWQVPTLAQHYSKAKTNAFLQSQVMHIPYILVDLNKRTDEEIISFYGKAISFCAGLLALKHVWDEDLLPLIKQVLDLYLQEQPTEDEVSKRGAIFVYLLRALRKREDFDRVTDYLKANKNKYRDIMSYFDIVLEEKKQEGKIEGKAEGIEENTVNVIVKALKAARYTLEEIANLTDKDVAYVKTIKAKLASGQL